MQADTDHSIGTLPDLLPDHVVIQRILLTEDHAIVVGISSGPRGAGPSRSGLLLLLHLLLIYELLLLLLEQALAPGSCLVRRGRVMHVLPLLALLELRMRRLLSLLVPAGCLLLHGDQLTLRLLLCSGCLCGFGRLLVTLFGSRFLELASAHEKSLHARRCLLLLLFLILRRRRCGELEGVLGAERRGSGRAYVQEGRRWSCLGPTGLLSGLARPFLVRLALFVHLLTLRGLGRLHLLAALFLTEVLGRGVEVHFELVGLGSGSGVIRLLLWPATSSMKVRTLLALLQVARCTSDPGTVLGQRCSAVRGLLGRLLHVDILVSAVTRLRLLQLILLLARQLLLELLRWLVVSVRRHLA